MKSVFIISTLGSESGGHGEGSIPVLRIQGDEGYGTGPLPPAFSTRQAAQHFIYRSKLQDKQVVELKFIES